MVTFKKFTVSILLIICCASLFQSIKFLNGDTSNNVINVKAKTKIVEDKSNPFYSEEFLNQYFQDLKPSDKVLKLPGGGYLHGEATILDSKGNAISTYNSETDPKAKTVEETKKELLSEGEIYE
ncbi:MAG: hypothetical protein KH431_03690 [Erysipelotrichaceae bacterium]|nr:hypothetical protein [Erysipelotrichaceae bacterium]